MLLKRRPPRLRTDPLQLRPGLEHLDQGAVAVLRWLLENRIDFVLVGPVARALRGDAEARGPVGIVPAPYGRNYERLCAALVAARAGLRADRGLPGGPERPEVETVKLTAEKLARGKRWLLRMGSHELDIEQAGAPSRAGQGRAPGYQELLYEASRIEPAEGLAVQVASPEDLEHYAHLRLTGSTPEFRVTRTPQAPRPEPSAGGEVRVERAGGTGAG